LLFTAQSEFARNGSDTMILFGDLQRDWRRWTARERAAAALFGAALLALLFAAAPWTF
jgi:hypothetical protein